MTNEKRYAAICEMLREFAIREGDHAMKHAEAIIKDPARFVPHAIPFYDAAANLLVDALAAMDTKTTASTVKSAVGRILKNASRDDQKRLYEINGKMIVCDGYRVVRLSADIASLPHAEKPAFDVTKLMENADSAKGEPIQLPTVPELKAYIAAHKMARKLIEPINLHDDYYVNPQYLLDMIQALPGCTVYKAPNYHSPLFFQCENGSDGILLPCRGPKSA